MRPSMTAVLNEICARHRPTWCSRTARAWRASRCSRRSIAFRWCWTSSTSIRGSGATWRPPAGRRCRGSTAARPRRSAPSKRAPPQRAVASLVVNEREADNRARAGAGGQRAACWPTASSSTGCGRRGPPRGSPRVVFCGVMSYAPNDQGMTWFVARCGRWCAPRGRTRRSPSSAPIRHRRSDRSASGDPSITVTGRVPDVREWLWGSAVGIAPLHVARGVQNKALEAIAAGLPIVITDAVAGGLPQAALLASSVSNTPEQFAQQTIDLLSMSPSERRARAASADLSHLTWSSVLSHCGLSSSTRHHRAGMMSCEWLRYTVSVLTTVLSRNHDRVILQSETASSAPLAFVFVIARRTS